MKYRAIIFDLFGTLVENFTRPEYEEMLRQMAAVVGAPPEEFIKRWAGTFNQRSVGFFKSTEDCVAYICRELGLTVSAAQLKRTADIRLDYTTRNMKPRDGALETLATLKKDGYLTALISDCTTETPLVWRGLPFAPFFNVTVFSCLAGFKKPDPRIYRLATEQLGVRPEQCLYIGDGAGRELSGALKEGMYAVQIRDPQETADAHYIEREPWHGPAISSLTELLDLL
jgi:putative hydrolase of the HAD superfamily